MAHRGVIVTELAEVNGWIAAGSGAGADKWAGKPAPPQQPQAADKEKVAAMEERELRRLRMRVEREAAAAAKAAKAEAASAAKLRAAQMALKQFELQLRASHVQRTEEKRSMCYD